jgi:hypothetical protein
MRARAELLGQAARTGGEQHIDRIQLVGRGALALPGLNDAGLEPGVKEGSGATVTGIGRAGRPLRANCQGRRSSGSLPKPAS